MKKKRYFEFIIVVLFVLSVSMLFLFENEKVLHTTSDISGLKTVVLDAGHGGEDGGAVGIDGILEKEINLDITKKLEMLLNLFGINTKMTRSEDVSLFDSAGGTVSSRKVADIKSRVNMVNKTPDAILISIHQNSFPQENCKGSQVFYSGGNINSKILASHIQESLRFGIDSKNRRKEKINDKSIYLLENVSCPAVLVECGFLTNPQEAQLLRKDTYKTKLAVCITAGLVRYQEEK